MCGIYCVYKQSRSCQLPFCTSPIFHLEIGDFSIYLYTLETYQILSPVLFQQSLYFPLLIHGIFIYVSLLFFFTCFAVLEESIQAGALLRPKMAI